MRDLTRHRTYCVAKYSLVCEGHYYFRGIMSCAFGRMHTDCRTCYRHKALRVLLHRIHRHDDHSLVAGTLYRSMEPKRSGIWNSACLSLVRHTDRYNRRALEHWIYSAKELSGDSLFLYGTLGDDELLIWLEAKCHR